MRLKSEILLLALLIPLFLLISNALGMNVPQAQPSPSAVVAQQQSLATPPSESDPQTAPYRPIYAEDVSLPASTVPAPCANLAVAISAQEDSLSTAEDWGDQQAGTDAMTIARYKPREMVRLAHPTNYGDRYQTDIYGKPVNHEYLVVLHETVYSAQSAINYFQTPHPSDLDQASYHTLIKRDGTVIYIVPPEKRAYGAGNSVFRGPRGAESVKTDRNLPPSVNNFAYHVSLETPSDGAHNGRSHSGYTQAQYQSLAWLIAKTTVPSSRITTHKAVDRSGSRQDPRSFRMPKFLSILSTYPRQTRASNDQCSPLLTQHFPSPDKNAGF